jgi:NHL repeat
MKITRHLTVGATIAGSLLAVALATGIWQPLAKADGGTKGPTFAVDPFWPKPLPAPVGADGVAHTWVTGEIAGSCTDKYDNVYTFNRGWEVGATVGGVLQGNESGAIVGQDATASAIPSPPVVAYNSDGDTVAGWGNPSLIPATDVDGGYAAYLPQGAHGCFVDYQGNIWVGGNGDGIVQEYNPQAANEAGANATFVMQIGTKGMCDTTKPPAPGANPFTSCNDSNDANSSHTLLNEPADIAVDPNVGPVSGTRGDIYIADGYGNHRVVVFNAAGQYVGQWGTACSTTGETCPPGTFGATGGGHPHCVVLGNDGLVYVCDRPDDRIQVFQKTCAVPSVSGSQPFCPPVRVINIDQFPTATAANKAAILLAGTRGDDMDFWPNIDYLASKSPTSQKDIVDVDLGNDNTWLLDKASGLVFGALGSCGIAPCPGHNAAHFAFGHTVTVDSKGNIYVAETITGRRIQKFVPTNGPQNW